MSTPQPRARQPQPRMQFWRSGRFWLVTLIVIGIVWRVARYAAAFPVWSDEAALGLNIINRSYLGLLAPLSYQQVCPLGFLWASKFIINQMGTSGYALRLLPLLAAIADVLMMVPIARSFGGRRVGLIAAGLLACSLSPARFANDFKPYSMDLFMSLAYIGLALGILRRPDQTWRLALLALLAPVSVAFSYPAIFVGAAASAALLAPVWRRSSRAGQALYILFNILLAGSFAGLLWWVGRGQMRRTHALMQTYWRNAFPPLGAGLPWWLVKAQFGNMMTYPSGGEWGISLVVWPLCVLGAWRLWAKRRRSEFILLLAPFAFTLAAAFLHKYPYGRDARVEQHLTGPILLLAALGFVGLLGGIAKGGARRRRVALDISAGLCAGLAIFATVTMGLNIKQPWISWEPESIWRFSHAVYNGRKPQPRVILLQNPAHYSPELGWYFRPQIRPWTLGLPEANAGGAPRMQRRGVWIINFGHSPQPGLARRLQREFKDSRLERTMMRYFHGRGARRHDAVCAQAFYFAPTRRADRLQ